MEVYQKEINGILISTDKTLLDMDTSYKNITESYWAKGIPRKTFEKSVENSLCFGVYKNGAQVGFARVISDFATFAYICDLFIISEHRGNGYSKILMSAIIGHPDLQGLRRICLGTWNAHKLYEKFGFSEIKKPENWMEIINPNPYPSNVK